MKKSLIFLFTFCVLILISIYVFIPENLEISKIEYINCNVNGAFRTISDESSWGKWWPKMDSGKSDFVEKSFFYNGYSYHLSQRFYKAIEVLIKDNNSSIESKINIIDINIDSIVLIWNCQLSTTLNPITKILKYRQAEIIKNNMIGILSNLHSFLDNKRNIYGIDLYVTMSKDSTMVATKSQTPNYPSTSDIYNLIWKLKKYIASQNAKENNFPMLHIKKLSETKFETMVAIPVNKQLAGNGQIFFSRFVPWKVLTAEVRGGNYTVDEALRQMKVFINDYQKTAMAIPFESLVTERSKEPDTLKWITRIYTPIP